MQQAVSRSQSSQSAAPTSVAQTRAEFDALLAKRNELGSQLTHLTDRRRELAEHARQSPDAASTRDFQAQLKILDDRGFRLQKDILEADDAITDAVARGVATTPAPMASTTTVPPSESTARGRIAGGMFGQLLVLSLLGVALWRFAWRRAEKKFARPAPDQSSRFDRLQQAVDVIALEVERISENQRYVTKVLNEKLQPALGAGEGQPIHSPQRSGAPVHAPRETG